MADARVTQVVAETGGVPPTETRVSQLTVEGALDHADVRVSQLTAEAAVDAADIRVSQFLTEAASGGHVVRITQVLAETISRYIAPPAPLPPATPRLIRRVRQTPHLSDEQLWVYVSSFQLDLETGRGAVSGQGIDPQIMLQWSDDGGHTWSDERWVSAGVAGAYAWRAIWRRLGRSRDRVWRVSVSDPVPWRLLDAYVTVEKGTS